MARKHANADQAKTTTSTKGISSVGQSRIYSTEGEKALSEAEHNNQAKHAALRYILDAWEEAVYDGIDPDCVATAAIFAALSDMIATYGEEPVAKMVERLPERIRVGEFTVAQNTQ